MAEINVTDVMLGDWVLYEHKNNRGVTVSTHCLKVENITNDSLCMRSGDYWRVQKTGLMECFSGIRMMGLRCFLTVKQLNTSTSCSTRCGCVGLKKR